MDYRDLRRGSLRERWGGLSAIPKTARRP